LENSREINAYNKSKSFKPFRTVWETWSQIRTKLWVFTRWERKTQSHPNRYLWLPKRSKRKLHKSLDRPSAWS